MTSVSLSVCFFQLFHFVIFLNFRYRFYSSSGTFDSFLYNQPLPSDWFHVAVVVHRNFTGITVYHDGVEVGEDLEVSNDSPDPAPGDLVVGRKYLNKDDVYKNVQLDEVTIWDVALTADEVQAIHDMHD